MCSFVLPISVVEEFVSLLEHFVVPLCYVPLIQSEVWGLCLHYLLIPSTSTLMIFCIPTKVITWV